MEERDLLVNAPGKHKKNAIKEDANISSANTNENLKSDRSTSPSSEMRSLAFQLASANNEHRKLRIQAENRDEDCRRLEATLEEKAKRVLFLENERIRLLEKERQAKQLGDDLQAAHYRIEKLRSLEGFEKKYKEASEALEYLMSKYEAVTEKYNAQEDWASELEKNLKSLRLENKDQCVIEDNLFRLKKTVSDLEAEMVRKNMEIEVCHDEKYRLTQELKEREERICQLEMTTTSISPQYMDSLANQLEHAKIDEFDIMKAQVRKLRAKTEEAIIDTSELTLQESDELKEQLSAEKLRNSELLSNYQKLQKEQEKIEGISKRVEIELEETILRSEKMQTERDSAINYLHYVRKILSQFKEEYGKQVEDESENDDRIYQFEVISLNEKIGESCQHAPEQLLMQANQNNKQVASRIDEGKTNNNLMKNSKKCVKKSYFEAKNCILKSEIDNFEDAIEGLKLQLSISKATHKRVNEKDDIIKNLHDKLGILENQLEVTQQQLDVELKKIERLRENLVFEKSMKTDLAGRLKSLCTKLAVNGGNFDVDELDDEQLIKKIDDIMMSALVTVKRESDTLRIQQTKQIAELLDLKKDIENLRQSERESCIESDDRVLELTKENVHTKEQVFLLQEKLREVNLELDAKKHEIEIAKNSIEKLNKNKVSSNFHNAEVARLQVSIRNAQVQEELIKQQSMIIREELKDAQKENTQNVLNLEELELMHKSLLTDYSRLQQLHNLLTTDYDKIKRQCIIMEKELHSIPKVQPPLMNSNCNTLETCFIDGVKNEEKQLFTVMAFEEDKEHLKTQVEYLKREAMDNENSFKKLAAEHGKIKETFMQQNSLVENLKKKLDSKISDIKKFEIKTEALDQLNRTYDEENKNLSRQLEILLNQNKELLQRALHDKDQYHLEMNNVQDQLCELRRHKEKLEDKILDQYRTMDVKKSPERKQPLMKRAAKALIHKKKSTSNSESTTEDSSNYSADEQVDHLLTGLVDDTDILFVTSSSSDDHEKITQNNEVNSKQWFRNDSIGGSLRVTNANRFNDRKLTNSSFRPPRTPIRNAFETSSLRLRQPPPPYKVIADSENKISQQKPNLKNFKVNANIERQIAREGEERAGIRDKEERLDKTMSYYENVSSVLEPLQNDDSTMWFEYGCV